MTTCNATQHALSFASKTTAVTGCASQLAVVDRSIVNALTTVHGMATWSDEEVFKLIDLWGEDSIQVQLETCKRNKWVYEKIATQMKEAGYDRSADQCREKAKKLKGEYRKVKDKQGKTGTGRVTWKFFDVLDDLLGTRPSTKPAVMVDSLRDSEDEITDTTPETETSVNEGKTQTEAPADQRAQPSSAATGTPAPTKKGKKMVCEDKIEQMMKGVVQQILASQETSDRNFLELEEKRLKFEEHMVEKEQQQKREEREFQLKMMSMMMQGPPPVPPYYPQQSHGPYAYPSYTSGLSLDDQQRDE